MPEGQDEPGIKRGQGSFTALDSLELHERWWFPEFPKDQTKAVVVLVHGLKDHGARYEHVGVWLAGRGYAVYALDLRGHGESGGERFFVDAFDEYVEDLVVFLDRVREREKGRPLFLLGHSMGGAVAGLFVLNREPGATGLSGLILTAPALEPNENVSPVLIRLSRVISRFFPRAPVTKVDIKSLSHLPSVVEAARKDPLSNERPAPARTGYEILRAMRRIRDRAAEITLPILVMHGTEDHLTNPRGSETLFKRAGSEDKTIKLYKGLYHEILNEPEQEQVLEDILSWMDARGRPNA
ncbi:MAG: lysophospholipase [Rubrobacteraceae bacterium]